MTRETILEGIRNVMAEHLAIREVDERTHLIRDLQLDSIKHLTLVVELENFFKLRFDEGDEAGLETVEDLVLLISGRLQKETAR